MHILFFFGLKKCFNLSELTYFLRTSTCYNQPSLVKVYEKTVRDGLPIVCDVNFDGTTSTQLNLLPNRMVLGFHPDHYFHFPLFWSQVLVRVTFSRHFLGNLRRCFVHKRALEMAEIDKTWKSSPWNSEKWTQPVDLKTAESLISGMDDKDSKVIKADDKHQRSSRQTRASVAERCFLGLDCKNLGLELDDQQLRISISSAPRPLKAAYVHISLTRLNRIKDLARTEIAKLL